MTQYDIKKLVGGVSDENVFEWPANELAVAFFLESGQPAGLRNSFFAHMLEVVRQVKGSSSTALDRHLGRPIEELDKPWRAWIRQQLEPPAKPTPTK